MSFFKKEAKRMVILFSIYEHLNENKCFAAKNFVSLIINIGYFS